MIERLTFAEICLQSTDLEAFQLTVHGPRRNHLTKLEFVVVLPGYSDEARCKFEDAHDRHVNDGAFTAAFRKLFNIIHQWEPEETGSLSLVLQDVYSSSDHRFIRTSDKERDTSKALLEVQRDENQKITDLWSFRFCYSYIRLQDNHGLPTVHAIRSFSMDSELTRPLADHTIAEILGGLPNIENAD